VFPILLYHQVAAVPTQHDPHGLAVSPGQFEQQMGYLHRAGYRCVSLAGAVRCVRAGRGLPRKSFVLTFDDGYRDLYFTVWPILRRFGFTATIFLVAGRAGGWSDWKGQTGPAAAPLLSWSEARELIGFGAAFGSHTVTHPRLGQLDETQALAEIQRSKAILEERLGVPIDLFSYPYANYNARIQRIVAETGYMAACGGDRGAWGFFNLWRAQCKRKDSMRLLALKAGGWYHRFIWLREHSIFGRPLRPAKRATKCLRKKARQARDAPGRPG
jgi:peptidoglycan/xylan/chitin deacetylase (PgdA/CDA1 family)